MVAIKTFDLTDGQVKEAHPVTDLDSAFGTGTSHGGSETTVKFEDGEFVENGGGGGGWFGELRVGDDKIVAWLLNFIPIEGAF